MSGKKIIRCAIYTRKSSEEGLEQDFNSLHAQREACEAYVKSQKHAGWEFLEKAYDDGGYSGGTLERPALKTLLADVADGLIDIIVVYKIDRLTRSLMDFSKIVEVLDKSNTSFVSITQHFNTTNSMGRLTLNMLLSFAQFEREVTGERIRDKYAASKQKGMWMGGKVPLGYYREDKKIFPDKAEVPKIKLIFEKYIELKTVHLLKDYLDNTIAGRSGKRLSKGNLYHILSSRTYLGEVGHKGKWYEGLHEGIVSPEVFNKAQAILQENRIKDRSIENCKDPSLLAGKIFDDKGNYMSPYHSSSRSGKRYRYYLSQAVIKREKDKIGHITKIAAGEIENLTSQTLTTELLRSKEYIQSLFKNLPVSKQKEIINKTNNMKLSSENIRSIISKICVIKGKIDINYHPEQLKEIILANYENRIPADIEDKTENTITKETKIAVVENGSKIIIGAGDISSCRNEQLIKAVLKSYKWHKRLMTKDEFSIKELCQEEGITKRYVNKILNLSYLSSKITEKILNGTQPRDLTFEKLTSIKTTEWKEQERLLRI